MNKISCLLLLCFCFLAVSLSAQTSERDAVKESAVTEELRAIDPKAVEAFTSATAALDAGNFAEADRLYAEVIAKVPDFDAALRRRGFALIALGHRSEGVELTKKALAIRRTVENLGGRANSLMYSTDPEFRPSPAEASEAAKLSKEAWDQSKGSDHDSGALLAEALLASGQYVEFDKFAPAFKAKFSESPAAGYYNAISLANSGDLSGAEAEVVRIKKLGFPEEAAASLLTAINATRDEAFFGLGRYLKYGYFVGGLVALWAIGLLGLFIVGRSLSSRTLQTIETSDPNDITGAAQGTLKKQYRRIIGIAGAYYYISQPFVIFLVVAVSAAIVLMFLWIGTIPIKLVLVLGVVAVVTVFLMIKALFTRVKVEDPGRSLTEAEAPDLWRMVRDVATTINTRPVTEIRLTHGTDLAVYERGTFREKMNDSADRILIIGAAVLNGFDQNAFRAVVAHEYGHFSNRDTAGGDIAFRVNSDIMRTAEAMANGGAATVYNLGFQFLRLFHFLFRRITLGASRLQEVLADRVAAYHFGAQAFQDGLNHVIRREVEFNHVADKEINAALGANRAMQNLYEMTVGDDSSQKEVDEAIRVVADSPTTDDDSHPSPADRFRYIAKIRSHEVERLNGEVWDLFADPAAVRIEMNQLVEKLVRGYSSPANDGILNLGN